VSLVLDSSATLAWIFPDETTDAVREVFETVSSEGCFVPTLWAIEVANGLTAGVRRRRITETFRAEALGVLELLSITEDGETRARAWTTTLHLADQFGLTLYDAAYLELARRLSLPLASLDDELRNAAQALGIELLGA
jgi:predicted nucleic acid-binding protein